MDESHRTLRKLGKLERFSSVRHGIGYYISVGMTATHALKAVPTSLEASVYAAFADAIQQQPMLSAIVVDERADAAFVQAPAIDLSKVIRFVERREALDAGAPEDKELDELVQREHGTRFLPLAGKTLPEAMWRAIVLTHPSAPTHIKIAFVFHHSIGDGPSGLILQRALASSFAKPETLIIADPQPIVTPATTYFPPAIDALLPLPLSIPYLLRALWNDKFPSRQPGLWTGAPPFATPSIVFRFRSRRLTVAETSAFAAACRAERTTFTAGFLAAIARAFFASLPDRWDAVLAAVPVSLRRFAQNADPAYPEQMAVAVASVEVPFRRAGVGGTDAAALWAEARRSKEELERVVGKGGKDTNTGLLKYVSDVEQFFTGKVGKPRAETFEVSSLGVVKEEGIGEVVFSQSSTVTGAALEISIVTGGDGRLSLGFSWQEGALDEEIVDKVIEDSISLLRDLSGASP